MNCNMPKPKKLPKSFYRLPQYEQDVLMKAMSDASYDAADAQLADTQEIWIKMSCSIWHSMGATEEQLLQYIASFKRMYRRNERIETEAEQKAWLDREMSRCFPTCGFPQFRIDEMKGATDERAD